MIRYKKDTDNIVTLTLDMQGRAANIINHEIGASFLPVLKHLKSEKAKGELRGVIITSSKKSFLSGGDLDYLYNNHTAESIFKFSQAIQKFHRDLESPGVPVVAAINGTALGSGFELALACHQRIAINDPEIRLGHPEVTLGMMPGGGGVIRLMWLLGVEKAFSILVDGKRFNPAEALEAGLIDELAVDEGDMMERAREWLMQHQEGRRSWDTKDGNIPGGTASSAVVARAIQHMAAGISKTALRNYPAPHAILSTLAEGSKVDFDTACRIESRYFTQLVLGQTCKNMMKAFWYDFNAVKDGLMRPKGFGKFRPKKVGIIGAGMMGSGIALSCLLHGMKVVLKDVSKPIADRGKETVAHRLEAMVQESRITEERQTKLLKNIITTEKATDFQSCDIVIEAVFENEMVKMKVTKEAEAFMDEYALFASNTVSIPITQLAKSALRPKNYIGLHFFAPVDKVPLVEIVTGRLTSDETIARAYDFVSLIRKTPILVKDTWGFYVSRVQNTYILEGIQMLQEGYAPALIENLGVQAGMPTGALKLADELSLNLVLLYENQAAAHYGSKYIQHPAAEVLKVMLEDIDRPGEQSGKGFYGYDENGNVQLWPALTEHFPTAKKEYSIEHLMERFLFAQVIEAVWCLQEGIIKSVPAANLGSIFGWGFPGFKGGVLQFVNDYGLENFIAKCEAYEKLFGPRFKVPKLLFKKLESPVTGA